jgi:cytochrome c-type biogenesis protein CcmH
VTVFIIVCAVMLLAAITAVSYPLLRPVASTVKGQPVIAPAIVPAAAIGVLLVIGAAAMYSHASNFPWKDPRMVEAVPEGHGDTGNAASMEEITRQLEAKLQANPNDAEGWRMLARTYLVTSRPKDAIGAYQKAVAIIGDKDMALQLDLAEAMILTEDPALLGKAKSIVDATLTAEPTSQKALWYSGVMAYRANDTETAKSRWTKLLEQNPPDEVRQIVAQQLSALGGAVPAAQAAASEPAAAAPMAGGAEASPAPQGRTIKVAVSIDPALAGRLKPGTVMFVSAREPGIPGPPLAAVRMTADQLPTTVVLSDANSMVDGRNLSAVNDVEVVARVAFGGSVMSTSGDLIGTAIQKKGGPEDLSVSISKVQP